MSLSIPDRPVDALTGSAFAALYPRVSIGAKYTQLIFDQLAVGNIPSFMRNLVAVSISQEAHSATYYVTPDYMCIGSDEDYLRVPMNPLVAEKLCKAFDASIPTPKMVRDTWAAAFTKVQPIHLFPGAGMTSMPYFVDHNKQIEEVLQSAPGYASGALVSGVKKDIVICRSLEDRRPFPNGHGDRVAIYGWFSLDGHPDQPLNASSHDYNYADYSHGLRLTASVMEVDGEQMTVDAVLASPELCWLISDEGPFSARYS